MSSEEIIRFEWLFVLVIVLGLGFWELFSLKRANRKAREEAAAAARARGGDEGAGD